MRGMSERVSVKTESGVADVRLHRPEQLNAIDRAMFLALIESASLRVFVSCLARVAVLPGTNGAASVIGALQREDTMARRQPGAPHRQLWRFNTKTRRHKGGVRGAARGLEGHPAGG